MSESARHVEAAKSGSPEPHLAESCRRFLSPERLAGEEALGYNSAQLREQFWRSADKKGMDAARLFEVEEGSIEHKHVRSIFFAEPTVRPHYSRRRSKSWEHRLIRRIERVENGRQQEALATTHDNVRGDLQVLRVEPV